MTGAPQASSEQRSSDLPEGALLVVALAAAAGVVLIVPALIAALLIGVRRAIGVRRRWLILLAPLAAIPAVVTV